MATQIEKFLSRARVRVYKKENDDRTSLCGEPRQVCKDEGDFFGKEFFEVTAHQEHIDYINGAYPSYVITEPFIPGMGDLSKLGTMEKPEPPVDPDRLDLIKEAIAQIPVEQYGQPAGGRPAMPKVGDVSNIVGFSVKATEIVAAMAAE